MAKPVIFIGRVKFLDPKTRAVCGDVRYCSMKLIDGKHVKGMFVADKLEHAVKAAQGSLKAGLASKPVFEAPQSLYPNSDGTLLRKFEDLSYDDFNIAQRMLLF